jgi:hypothetical protein
MNIETSNLTALTFGKDNQTILAGSRLWDVRSGDLLSDMSVVPAIYNFLASGLILNAGLSADGKVIAVTYGSGIRLWGVPVQ